MSKLRMIYLTLAILGALVPSIFFAQWTLMHSVIIFGEVTDTSASGLLTAISWDIAVTVLAFFVFVVTEVVARKNYLPLLVLPVTLIIGLSCGLPLYLFLRSRPLD